MANAGSLHIGINEVDPLHYNGWTGKLSCCENDALFYSQVAEKAGIPERKILLSSAAPDLDKPISTNVDNYLKSYSGKMLAGDFLFITYSGHGGQIRDINHDEGDFQDETWCLYDRQFIDDELWTHFSHFKKGVRILLISDSCHSGSISRAPASEKCREEGDINTIKKFTSRNTPKDIALEAFDLHKQDYAAAVRQPIIEKNSIDATVLLIGACQDEEKAMESDSYGLMTAAIRKMLLENERIGNYKKLHSNIFEQLSAVQRPNLFVYGSEADIFCEEEIFRIYPDKYFSFGKV